MRAHCTPLSVDRLPRTECVVCCSKVTRAFPVSTSFRTAEARWRWAGRGGPPVLTGATFLGSPTGNQRWEPGLCRQGNWLLGCGQADMREGRERRTSQPAKADPQVLPQHHGRGVPTCLITIPNSSSKGSSFLCPQSVGGLGGPHPPLPRGQQGTQALAVRPVCSLSLKAFAEAHRDGGFLCWKGWTTIC